MCCLCKLSEQFSVRMIVSEIQERWEIPGAEFLPGTGENGAKEGAVKRYLAFSVGPRLPSVPYFKLASPWRCVFVTNES